MRRNVKHWVLWRLSPTYRRQILDDDLRRFKGFWEAAAISNLSQTEVGRAALMKNEADS